MKHTPFQPQDNFTVFSNYVLDVIMPELKPTHWKVLCFIIRKTIGWQKANDILSYSQIMQGTGISGRATVNSALKELIELNYISVIETNNGEANGYKLNTGYNIDLTSSKFELVRGGTSSNFELGPVQNLNPQKKGKKLKDISSSEGPSVVGEGQEVKQPELVKKEPTEHQRMFEAICYCIGWDYQIITKEQAGQVAQALGKLKNAGYTTGDLQEFHRWWHREDWRGKQGQLPTLTQLRAEIGKVKKGQNGYVGMGNGDKPYRGMEVLA